MSSSPRWRSTAWTIYADGPIDADAADQFDQIVRQKNIPAYSTAYLNSPGESVIAAIDLGHAFRRYGLNTSTEKFNQKKNWPSLDTYCISSCTLAYFGGVFRYMYDNSYSACTGFTLVAKKIMRRMKRKY